MNKNWNIVNCDMDTCVHYMKVKESGNDTVYCKHPDRKMVRQGGNCPLYRLDWQKQSGANDDLRKKLLGR